MEHLQLCRSQDKFFLPARFDESSGNSEMFIISGFGEYVAVWSFNKVLRGYYNYEFRKVEDEPNQVQFKFNDPKKVLLATHNRVSMQSAQIK